MAWTDAARAKSAASRRARSVTKKRWINPRSKPRTMAQRADGVRRGASDRNKLEPYRTYGHQSDFGLYSNLAWAKSNPASSLKAHNQRRNAIKRKLGKPVSGKRAGNAVSELGDAANPIKTKVGYPKPDRKPKVAKAAKGYTISRGTNAGKTASRIGKKYSRG